MISRRVFLTGAVGLSSCGPKLAKRFNGYALVANRGSQTLAAVNLTRFRTEKQIPLKSPPASVMAFAGSKKALVLLPDAGTVVEVTAESLSLSHSQQVADKASALKLIGGSDRVWLLCNEPQGLVALNLKSWKPSRRFIFRLRFRISIYQTMREQRWSVTPEGSNALLSIYLTAK